MCAWHRYPCVAWASPQDAVLPEQACYPLLSWARVRAGLNNSDREVAAEVAKEGEGDRAGCSKGAC
eukprot:15476088-Alexandrium_andersonii.AAC.1